MGNLAMRKRAGFTLLEIMVAMIIMGMLITIALPKYSRVLERSRQAEAITILGTMRGAQLRYYVDTGNYTTVITNLDIELPDIVSGGDPDGKFFNYTVPGAQDAADLADATRKGFQQTAGVANYKLRINRSGNITCQSSDCAGIP